MTPSYTAIKNPTTDDLRPIQAAHDAARQPDYAGPSAVYVLTDRAPETLSLDAAGTLHTLTKGRRSRLPSDAPNVRKLLADGVIAAVTATPVIAPEREDYRDAPEVAPLAERAAAIRAELEAAEEVTHAAETAEKRAVQRAGETRTDRVLEIKTDAEVTEAEERVVYFRQRAEAAREEAAGLRKALAVAERQVEDARLKARAQHRDALAEEAEGLYAEAVRASEVLADVIRRAQHLRARLTALPPLVDAASPDRLLEDSGDGAAHPVLTAINSGLPGDYLQRLRAAGEEAGLSVPSANRKGA